MKKPPIVDRRVLLKRRMALLCWIGMVTAAVIVVAAVIVGRIQLDRYPFQYEYIGVVKDMDNNPVGGASVRIVTESGSEIAIARVKNVKKEGRCVMTDSSGMFQFVVEIQRRQISKDGRRWMLRVERAGYARRDIEITPDIPIQDVTTFLSIVLQPAAESSWSLEKTSPGSAGVGSSTVPH